MYHDVDYPALPFGPVVLIRLPLGSTDADLSHLSADAAVEKWIVYESGFVPLSNPNSPDQIAYIVLHVATTEFEYRASI